MVHFRGATICVARCVGFGLCLFTTLAMSRASADNYQHVIVAASNGDINEVYFKGGGQPIGQDRLVHFDGVVSVAGYLGAGDGYQHIIVARRDRTVNEVYFQGNGQGVHQDVLATFSNDVVAVAGYFAPSDQYQHVVVASANGTITEVYFRGNGQGIHEDTLAHFPGVVAIAGYYAPTDGYQHVIVATADGKISEVYFKGNGQGVNQGLLAQLPGVAKLAAYYAASDQYQHVIVATATGDVNEVYYKGGGQPIGQDRLVHFGGVVSVAGYFSAGDNYQHVIVASANGDVNEVYFKGGGQPIAQDRLTRVAGIVSIAGYDACPANLADTSGLPRYNEIAFQATHNSYWVKRDNVVEAGASGTEVRILDQLLFEGVRSIELDVHRDDPHAHQFTIYHTDKGSNSLCMTLDDCMKQLVAFQHALPEHDVLTIVLESKEIVWGGIFDDKHSPEDLDAILEKYLGQHLYRPRDLLSRCQPNIDIRDCLSQRGWPHINELRGKFIVALIGNWNGVAGPASEWCGPHSIDNRGSWVAYANSAGGIAARSAFLMESPWATNAVACQSSFNQAQVNTAVAAAAFVQLETDNSSGLLCNASDTGCPLSWVARNLVVRGDIGGQSAPNIPDQIALERAGISLIQNDHPWFGWHELPFVRVGIPLYPGRLVDRNVINEPGHRILLIQNHDGARAAFTATLGGAPRLSTRWETTVANTRPTTDSRFPNARKARGVGCLYARTLPSPQGNSQYGLRICRTTADGHWNVSKPLGEDAIVTVDVIRNQATNTFTFYSNANDTNGAGELLRLDVKQSSSTACVSAFTSESVIGDDPQWRQLEVACFPSVVSDQGLAAEGGDVLFVGTKLAYSTSSEAPASASGYFELQDSTGPEYNVQNLSWPR